MTIINRTDEPMEVTVEGKPVTLKENGGWVNTTADNPELLARGDARLEEMIAKGEVRIVEEWFHTIKPNRRQQCSERK